MNSAGQEIMEVRGTRMTRPEVAFGVLRNHGIACCLILWLLDPLERGHHDKDPSKDDGNEVNSTNTFEGFG